MFRTRAAFFLLLAAAAAGPLNAQTSPGLRIVVIEGENAVNVIQQKSAVAPVVEVRDRNNQPVAGVMVRFAIRAGKATFGGPRTLAVTTNSAGRAAVATLTPTGSGALQITATAALQGETAAVTIAQTNVMTAAAAASASGGAAAGGAGAGGSGSGVSATTLSVVGGAAAGGVVAAVKLTEDPGPTTAAYAGSYSVTYDRVFTSRTSPASCTYTIRSAGTITANLTDDNGSITGDFDLQGTETVLATNGCGVPVGSTVPSGFKSTVTGSTTSFTGSKQNSGTGASGNTVTQTLTFTASLSASVVTGTLSWNDRLDSPIDIGLGSATTSVTLR